MPDDHAAAHARAVVVPAGEPLLDAARWVGHACWAELRLHEVLTGWLADEADPELVTVLWSLRAHRAELAEAWHRRLPELREFPRAGFVLPSDRGQAGASALEALTAADATSAERVAALGGALAAMADHYRDRVPVAVGPADAPTADTLARALARTESDRARLSAT